LSVYVYILIVAAIIIVALVMMVLLLVKRQLGPGMQYQFGVSCIFFLCNSTTANTENNNYELLNHTL